MRIPNASYLIIDLEATCSNDQSVPRTEMEIIEIGAVLQDTQSFGIQSEFQTFVRPVRHPQLTPFCMQLTSITQAQVDAAPPFPEALAALVQWLAQFPDPLFCSWGNYDRNQFQQDCRYHGVPYPFSSGHLNLKAEFARTLGLKRELGIDAALRQLGLQFEGTPHRGIDDVRNIARIIRRVCLQQG